MKTFVIVLIDTYGYFKGSQKISAIDKGIAIERTAIKFNVNMKKDKVRAHVYTLE